MELLLRVLYKETNLGVCNDSSVFVTSFVPIKLLDSLGEWENM